MILVDYNNVAMTAYYSTGAEDNPEPEEVRFMIVSSLGFCNNKFRTDYGKMVICCDGKGSWRYNVFPSYKARRRKKRKDKKEQYDKMFKIFGSVRDELKEHFPYPVVHLNEEADDIIAHLVLSRRGKERNLIYSNDSDYIQLIDRDTDIYQPNKKEHLTIEDYNSQDIEDFLKRKILKGDPMDDIPNVLSSNDTFITEGLRQVPMTQKRYDNLLNTRLENMDVKVLKRYEENSKLIDFTRIPEDVREKIEEAYKSSVHSRTNLLDYFIKNRLGKLVERIHEF